MLQLFTFLSVLFAALSFTQAQNYKIDNFLEGDPSVAAHVIRKGRIYIGALNSTTSTKVMELFKRRVDLGADESVNIEGSKISYELFPENERVLLKHFTVKHGTIRVGYRQDLVKSRVMTFLKREPLFEEIEQIQSDLGDSLIIYELLEYRADQLKSLVNLYDQKPYQVLVQAKLLSVSNQVQNQMAGAFSAAHLNSSGQTTSKLLSGVLSPRALLNIHGSIGKFSLDAMLNAIQSDGKGRRMLFPDITTTESYGVDSPPIVFSQKTKTPIVNSTSTNSTVSQVEVGLGITIKKIQVIEPPDFEAKKERIQKAVDTWIALPENQEITEIIRQCYEGNYKRVPLARIDEFIYKLERDFQSQFENLYDTLTIIVDAEIKDGGILRTVETSNSVTPEYTENTYSVRLTMKNKMPRFLGGSQTRSLRQDETKVPVFGSIPLVGRLFKSSSNTQNFDSLVGFLTVTVLDNDERTEKNAAGSYAIGGNESVVPMYLGGTASNGAASPRLSTGTRSRLKWMYDEKEGLLLKAYNRLPNQSIFAREFIGYLFNREILQSIDKDRPLGELEWLDFNFLKPRIHYLYGYGDTVPFISAMKKLISQVHEATGVELTGTEVLAMVRDQGLMGRGANFADADERVLMYMAWLLAKYNNEHGVFANKDDIDDYEKNYFDVRGKSMRAKYIMLDKEQ